MNYDLDLFRGTENFLLILKKIEQENKDDFEEVNVSYEECCILSSQNNKISLVEVNSKLPIPIRERIEYEWEQFCKDSKYN